jgi:lauroyl/myristoyl acyltransferase
MNSPLRKELQLQDIPFSATKAPENAVPVHWLWKGGPERRAAWRQYWIIDTFAGGINYGFHHLLRLLPVSWSSELGANLSTLARWRYRHQDFAKRIRLGMVRLRPDLATDPLALDLAEAQWWRNTGRVFAEFSRLMDLWYRGRIKIEGSENLATAKAGGTKVVFVSVHVGSWEALAAISKPALGVECVGPYQPEPNRFSNRIIYEMRKRRGQYGFAASARSTGYIRRLCGSGAASGFIMIDEVRDNQTQFPLFGRKVPAVGNVRIAVKLATSIGAVIQPVYMIRERGARFRAVVLPTITPTTGPDRLVAQNQTIRQLDDVFDPIVRANIDSWYMLVELRPFKAARRSNST